MDCSHRRGELWRATRRRSRVQRGAATVRPMPTVDYLIQCRGDGGILSSNEVLIAKGSGGGRMTHRDMRPAVAPLSRRPASRPCAGGHGTGSRARRPPRWQGPRPFGGSCCVGGGRPRRRRRRGSWPAARRWAQVTLELVDGERRQRDRRRPASVFGASISRTPLTSPSFCDEDDTRAEVDVAALEPAQLAPTETAVCGDEDEGSVVVAAGVGEGSDLLGCGDLDLR